MLSPAAIGIILNHDHSQVLLVKRCDIPVWILPGGGVDLNETSEQAVMRELYEETGFQVRIIRKCAEYQPINRLASFTTVFLCEIIAGKASLSSETNGIAFYPLTNINNVLLPLHAHWLQEILSQTTLIRRTLEELSYYAAIKYLIKHPYYTIRYLWTRFTR